MPDAFILALDQGTTSSRAILFDRRGRAVAVAQQEFPQHFPQPGWVEHDPEDIWRTQTEVARQAIRLAGAAPGQIAAVGITNQRETTVVWDRETGAPVYNAIVWQCRRTAAIVDDLRKQGFADTIREKTGLVLDAYFSGTKLRWLLENVPGLRAKAERGQALFGTIDSFLIWRLTGGRVHTTDASNASRTMLYNIRSADWDDDILAMLNIPRAMLPAVAPSSQVYGLTDPAVFGAAIALAGDAGDQQAALFGQACLEPGMAKNTYGTGCFLLMNTGSQPVRSHSGLLTTVAWRLGSALTYALEGSVFITGAAIQWLRDGLGIIASAPESEEVAGQVENTGGVYFVPAFVGLGAPYWDMYARGAILGLTRGTTRAHLVRATLESITFQTRDVLQAMQADSGVRLTSLRVDGGAARNNLLMQMQADILGVPVVRPLVTETTALGAAYLAGLATGYWRDVTELAALWQQERVFTPTLDDAGREARYARWRRAVDRAAHWEEPAGEVSA